MATPSGMVPPTPANPVKPVPDDAVVTSEVYAAISSYNKNFSKKIFENSITPIQLLNILNEWGWGPTGMDWDVMDLKRLVDTYDFNGDGNLSPEEFTILQIHTTIKKGYQCQKHCFTDIIFKILEPLFMYMDCDSDGYVNSENLWSGFKNIFRDKSAKYNMYQCNFPIELNEHYRTNVVNDFILKASSSTNGFLNRDEFITGILSGFWERETDMNSYGDTAEKLEGIKNRWGSAGTKDIECDKILTYFN